MSEPVLTLLHLSDLHFGQARGGHPQSDPRIVFSRLLEDIQEWVNTVGTPNLILVTGDIAFSGRREEYEQATTKLEELLMVPGNHDVDRTFCVDHPERGTFMSSSG